jgi:cytochrome d ubiquinol oxidase subunit II
MSAAELLRLVIGGALVAYVVTGGADFGAGVWDLLARGPTKPRQRVAIAHAIAPIWEANHIWLILVVVLAFTGFPVAFAVVATALHVPIALALVGIVLRGAAFTFRAYGLQSSDLRHRWGAVFAWSSVLTPVCLGLVVAAMASGEIAVADGRVTSGYTAGWATPFALAVGLFALACFVLLAAVYLVVDVDGDHELQRLFVRRALVCEVITGAAAAIVAVMASVWAPVVFAGLFRAPWGPAAHGTAFVAACTTIVLLRRGQYRGARVCVAVQIAAVVVGLGVAMGDELVVGAVGLGNAGTVAHVVEPVLWVLAAGGLVLGPALWWLFRVFKSAASRDDAL